MRKSGKKLSERGHTYTPNKVMTNARERKEHLDDTHSQNMTTNYFKKRIQ